MKLSEIPISLYHSARLKLLSAKSLQKNATETVPVIISLTSIPYRLKTLSLTIKSLMAQDVRPEKIVLWLHEDLREKLPKSLDGLQGGLFEIRFSPYTFSHRKLIHSLKAFPDKIIITCDDDLIYPPSSLRLTYAQYQKKPDAVIGNRCREITYDAAGNVKPYVQWPFVSQAQKDKRLLMPVGAFLVLYPPHILEEDIVANVALFNQLAPKADDLWFKVCTLLNHKLSVVSDSPPPEPIPIMGTQGVALKHKNKTEDFNRAQWQALVAYFKLKF